MCDLDTVGSTKERDLEVTTTATRSTRLQDLFAIAKEPVDPARSLHTTPVADWVGKLAEASFPTYPACLSGKNDWQIFTSKENGQRPQMPL